MSVNPIKPMLKTSFGPRIPLGSLLGLAVISVVQAFAQDDAPSDQVSFHKKVLLDKYVSEGASIGDMDNDGHMDVVAGVFWWQGPDFKDVHTYAPPHYFPITGPGLTGYADNFFTFPEYLDSDTQTDVLRMGLPGTDSEWIKNPGGNSQPMGDTLQPPAYHKALPKVSHESPGFMDIIGDARKEILAFSNGYLVLGEPSEKEDGTWNMLPISEKNAAKFKKYSHGLGAGDLNMDGRKDIIERSGWWEQPKNWDRTAPWKYHAYPFSPGKGGAQMFAYDVDGDGDNDVVTAMNGHGYGLSWFEHMGTKDSILFKEHPIMTDRPEDNPYGVAFSQLHAMAMADMDKDGIPDIVTGKCYYAHNGRDPGAEDPAVLYWFRTVRHADGTAELVPYKIDDDSGVGRQISVGDLNGDGKLDVVVSNKKGVFAFVQN